MAQTSEEVFRFVNLRPAQLVPEKRKERGFASYGEGMPPLQKAIAGQRGADTRGKAVTLAKDWLEKNALPDDKFAALQRAVESTVGDASVKNARETVAKHLGQSPADFLKSEAGTKLRDTTWDALYAHTLAPEVRPQEREKVIQAARNLHFLSRISKQGDQEIPMDLVELETVRPLIPRDLVPPAPARDQEHDKAQQEEAKKALDDVHARMQEITNAIDDLQSNDRKVSLDLQRQIVTFPEAPAEQVQAAKSHLLKGPSSIGVQAAATAPTSSAAAKVATKAARATAAVAKPGTASTALIERFDAVPKMQPWHATAEGAKLLSAQTNKLLERHVEKLGGLELPDVIERLESQRHDLVANYVMTLSSSAKGVVQKELKYKELFKVVPLPWMGFSPSPAPAPAPVGVPSGTPSARGIQPLGVGDLLVVRQQLLRYATGEVAHIENVMKTEFHSRAHTRSRETEEIVITETEQMEESEKDLQSTERFELAKETQKTIQDQMSLQAGVSVTAGYGPVSVTAHADFALSNSTTEASKTASHYAKEVTDKSVSKIMQRSREVRTRRTVEKFEERNDHGFDNKQGPGHVIGVYRWVDKYYKARLINYGKRLMIEFIVPEPAAFFRYLEANKPLEGLTATKPVEPIVSGRALRPSDLTRSNYGAFVARYGVEGVDPCPAPTVAVSAAFADATSDKSNMSYGKTSEKLVVPKGYKCYDVYGNLSHTRYGDKSVFRVMVAGQAWGSVTAKDVEGIIPISVVGVLAAFQVNAVAICKLTDEAFQQWQQKTYDAIMSAYNKKLADYNEQVSAAQIQAGVRIEGRNPDFNRKIERDELKKGALRLLTNNFAQTRVSGTWRMNESFNAMSDYGAYGYPEFATGEALVEGKIIQFFEQAFEWTNMTYRFYPYIWGRKSQWKDVFPLTDPDPQFTDFLRAGAARVVVPAHPNYAEAVLHYMATSEIWNGGEPPTLNDPLYVSLVEELKADAGGDLDADLDQCSATSGYPCLADEWEVKLPTTLVYLQPDDKLPDYTV